MNAIDRRILTYSIACGDMYYEIEGARAICLIGYPKVELTLCGQLLGAEHSSQTNLAEALLEFVMSQCAHGRRPDTLQTMDDFGKCIGEAVAAQVISDMPTVSSLARAAYGLEIVLRSLAIPFVDRSDGETLQYSYDQCPLTKALKSSGIRCETEIAHYGLNTLYQHLIQTIDPALIIILPTSPNDDQIIRVEG